MAYILGCVVPVVLAVAYVWTLGIVVGGIAWLVTIAIGAAVFRFAMRKIDPMDAYKIERQ